MTQIKLPPTNPGQFTAGFWRGNYFTALEGSLRTSFLIRWPGEIQAKPVNNEVVHITDILPTFPTVAGYKANVLDAWFMPHVVSEMVKFQMTLRKTPAIRLGTPDPYTPKK